MSNDFSTLDSSFTPSKCNNSYNLSDLGLSKCEDAIWFKEYILSIIQGSLKSSDSNVKLNENSIESCSESEKYNSIIKLPPFNPREHFLLDFYSNNHASMNQRDEINNLNKIENLSNKLELSQSIIQFNLECVHLNQNRSNIKTGYNENNENIEYNEYNEDLNHLFLLVHRVRDNSKIEFLVKKIEKLFPLPPQIKGIKRIRKRDNIVDLLIYATHESITKKLFEDLNLSTLELREKLFNIKANNQNNNNNNQAYSEINQNANHETNHEISNKMNEYDENNNANNEEPIFKRAKHIEGYESFKHLKSNNNFNNIIGTSELVPFLNFIFQKIPKDVVQNLQLLSIPIDHIFLFPNRLPFNLKEFFQWKDTYKWEEMNISNLFAIDRLDREFFIPFTNESQESYEKRISLTTSKWIYYVQSKMKQSPRSYCLIVDNEGSFVAESWDESPPRLNLYYNSEEMETILKENETKCRKYELISESKEENETNENKDSNNSKESDESEEYKNLKEILTQNNELLTTYHTNDYWEKVSKQNPIKHSCICAIDKVAAKQLLDVNRKKDVYLCTGYSVFCSHEPCVMCSMALVHARIKRLFFFKKNQKGGIYEYGIHENKQINHHYRCYHIQSNLTES